MKSEMKDNNLQINYDDGVDVLYISIGKPLEAICIETDGGDVIRVDPYTDEIIGLTILDFQKKILNETKRKEETRR